MMGTIKNVIVAAGIGKALSATIAEGAALEQSIGGIETLFKESADKVKQNAAEAYRTAGMSANEYMELTTSFQQAFCRVWLGTLPKQQTLQIWLCRICPTMPIKWAPAWRT